MDKELELTDYEKGYLTGAMSDQFLIGEEDDWFGIKIGDRMFDVNVWIDEDTGETVRTVYECDWIGDNWQTNCEYSWTMTEENEDER